MDSTARPDEDARREPGRPPEPEAGRRLFDRLRATGLQRPEEGWIGGVMALVAQRLRWDPTLVRGVGVVAALLFFSPMILLYGLAWILLPDHRERIPAQRAIRGDVTGGFVVGALLTVLGALNVVTPLNLAGPFAVLANVVIIAVVVGLVVTTTRGRRGRQGRRRDDAGGSAEPSAGPSAHPGGGDAAGEARAGRAPSTREDGRPAWFPKDSAPSTGAAAGTSAEPPASATAAAAADGGARAGGRHE
ncbi:PspC domain-containing protein, partial [Nesterenkonia sp. F]|uniref:PspC domain-containing protein n=1 Tax=Nesterenkonia sp. F TaxID=795955 RepID=UPI000255D1CD